MHDSAHDLNVISSAAPAARTATYNGAAIDLQSYDSVTIALVVGAWTDGTHTPKLQESDDASIWTDVAAGDLVNAFSPISSSAGQNAVQRVGYVGYKRYVRPVLSVSGSPSTGLLSSVTAIRGRSLYKPAG